MPVKIILLILFGLFVEPDGAVVPREVVATGQSGVAFKSVEDCERVYGELREVAKKNPAQVRALGHACVEITPELFGSDI